MAKRRMISATFYVNADQLQRLRKLSVLTGVSLSSYVGQGIDSVLSKVAQNAATFIAAEAKRTANAAKH